MKIYRWMVGHTTRHDYWSCSPFAAWLRKHLNVEAKPNAATPEEWCEYKQRNENKFAYWLVEEGLNYIQDFFLFPSDVYRHVRVYIKNRYIDKPHYLDTKLKRGEWHEFDTRVLYGLFETLVDFVEVEHAHMLSIANPNNKVKTPNREAGLKHLDWEISLGNESAYQSDTAKDVKELYLWWKDVRPNRPDAFEASGLAAYYNERRGDNNEDPMCLFGRSKETEEQKAAWLVLSNKNEEIEQRYHDEDTEMAIRLIKIRSRLWT